MNTVVKFFFGPQVALALKLLQTAMMVFESISRGLNPNVAPFAKEIFKHLPESFKAPKGSATEQEFVDAIFNVFSLFTKPKAK